MTVEELASRLRVVGFALVVALMLIFALGINPIIDIIRGFANFWTLGLVVFAAATLVWFFYWICLRRLLRVRRIANIRLRRMLEERDSNSSDSQGDQSNY